MALLEGPTAQEGADLRMSQDSNNSLGQENHPIKGNKTAVGSNFLLKPDLYVKEDIIFMDLAFCVVPEEVYARFALCMLVVAAGAYVHVVTHFIQAGLLSALGSLG
ncbi:hypothetical protein Celaphus_00001298 [Cervus elaphus hippelaphus]|uniref:Uncharacterized protein n=1 Tax=Cervus elaphus hippelaphus TaxID=46360 RepID=A0A212D7L9_CEREH|nr:hypothetical protein Celaphus_00001298 [Cervus elaphus hippelaphus]